MPDPKKFIRVADGVFKRGESFFERPWINGKRTWRKIPARTIKQAVEVFRHRRDKQRLAKEGFCESPYARPKSKNIKAIVERYIQDKCPSRDKKPRSESFLKNEHRFLRPILAHFGTSISIDIPAFDDYFDKRTKEIKKGVGARTISLEINALSNAVAYSKRLGLIKSNPLPDKIPAYYSTTNARHCRECAPETTEELHRIASYFFENPKNEVFGWQLLFEAMTGVRTGEALGLKWNAKKKEPGFIEDEKWLWIHRQKSGTNPFIVLYPELIEMLQSMKEWHEEINPESPWLFPSVNNSKNPIYRSTLSRKLTDASKIISEGKPRTSHGLRAFYVTARRSQGASDGQIASEIGDKTASLIERTYGAIPPNWRGSGKIKWKPAGFPPAWETWKGPSLVDYEVDYEAKNEKNKISAI